MHRFCLLSFFFVFYLEICTASSIDDSVSPPSNQEQQEISVEEVVTQETSSSQKKESSQNSVKERLNAFMSLSARQLPVIRDNDDEVSIFQFLLKYDTKGVDYAPIVNYYQNQTNLTGVGISVCVFDSDTSVMSLLEKIELRELYRFKNFIKNNPDIIHIDTLEKNDIGKAIILSGVIWAVPSDSFSGFLRRLCTNPEPVCSGIIKPGQSFDSTQIEIYTCLHGFKAGNKNNNINYYFVPFGQVLSKDKNDPCYIKKVGYKIQAIREYTQNKTNGTTRSIDEAFFEESKFLSMENTLNDKNDFAAAYITPKTLSNKTLKQHLQELHPNLINTSDEALPSINEASQETGAATFLQPNEQMFLIGNSKFPDLSLSFDKGKSTTISTNLTNDITIFNKKYKTTLPNFSGMSGGGVIRCAMQDSQNACVLIGTLFGSHHLESQRKTKGQVFTLVNIVTQ